VGEKPVGRFREFESGLGSLVTVVRQATQPAFIGRYDRDFRHGKDPVRHQEQDHNHQFHSKFGHPALSERPVAASVNPLSEGDAGLGVWCLVSGVRGPWSVVSGQWSLVTRHSSLITHQTHFPRVR
jgi:hypothetical protein